MAKLATGNGAAAGAPTGIAGLEGGNTAGDAAGGKTGTLARFGSWFAQVAATGYFFVAPLLLVVLGWHYRRRLVWPARLALGALALLVVSACSSDSPKAALPGGSVQVLTAEDTLIFSDPLGSALVETNGTGEVRGRFASYPYGVSRYDTSSEISKYATGIRDKSASLDQVGARFYSHQLGFWISGDPVAVDEPERYLGAEFGAVNPYAYANLTPMVARDSSGEFWQVLAGAIVGGAVGAGLQAAAQMMQSNGHITDWGRIGAAAFGGAVGGAIATACPQAGLGMVLAQGAVANAAAGLAERGVSSGGKDFGTLKDVAIDGAIGMASAGAARGLGKAMQAAAARSLKPATVVSAQAAEETVSVFHGSIKNGPAILENGLDAARAPTFVSRDLAAAQNAITNHPDAVPGLGTIIESLSFPGFPGHPAKRVSSELDHGKQDSSKAKETHWS
ncbi:MAG: RHS repeat-associated core domain-containing protein [Polyangiaceae bacterium]|nr:RHS repeat-associated core domain-containing protein [Polyangiaceae bacterium]